MRKVTLFIIILCSFLTKVSFAQLDSINIGQTPSSSFPVCGSNVFIQSSVPSFGGKFIPVPQCGTNAPYSDINPFFYKFTCFKTGTFGFLISPNNLQDDYDWDLFDITNHNDSDIYTDNTLSVGFNWSGISGVTGANNTGTSLYNCGGLAFPNISAMPTLIKGHNYILLVSHFTSSDQSGYSLSFNGGNAIITDTLSPKIATAKLKCSGDKIGLKLDKPMLCSTLDKDGSGFSITSNPKIDSVVGHGCKYGFDMDSVTVFLASPLDTGSYKITTKPDNKGGQISDICGTFIPINDTFSFIRKIEVPTRMDSLTTPLPCAPQQLQLVFKTPMLCSSVEADGSQFFISGPSKVTVTSATTNCDSNGVANIIYITLSAPITTDGIYKIHLTKGANFTTLTNECSVPTPIDSISFKAIDSVSAAFTINTYIGCKKDTIYAGYKGVTIGTHNTSSWQWTLDSTAFSTDTSIHFIDSTFKPKSLQLTVSNGTCSNTFTQSITPLDHRIKAGFTISADTICPQDKVTFTDTSMGVITSYKWHFGDSTFDSIQAPLPHALPKVDSLVTYKDTLSILNQVGCRDTAFHKIIVRTSKPSLVDSVVFVNCYSSSIHFFLDAPIRCSSIDSNGSNFTVVRTDRPDTVSIANAKVVSCSNNLGNEVEINLNTFASGEFKVFVHKDSTGSRIVNECNIPSPDTSLYFTTPYFIGSEIYDSILIGCQQDTLLAFDSCKAATSWKWVFDTTQTSLSPTPKFIFTGTTSKTLKLYSANKYCSDSGSVIILPPVHVVKAAFTTQDSICPNIQATFNNQSIGNLITYLWNFGKKDTSHTPTPLPVSYPMLNAFKTYTVSLIVKDSLGCLDTAVNKITIRPGITSLMDSIRPLPCTPQLVDIKFTNDLQCSSLNPNGSNFTITGPSIIQIDSAKINCNNSFGNEIKLYLDSAIKVPGNYLVKIQKASDGSQLLSACDIPSTLGKTKAFQTLPIVDARFDTLIHYGCKVASITYSHNGLNDVNSWLWTIDDTLHSTHKDTTVNYDTLNPKSVKLKVSNGICSDSTLLEIISLANYNDTVKAVFGMYKDNNGTDESVTLICPREKAIYIDTSIGKINSWNWDFGDNQTSNVTQPDAQTYPYNTQVNIYPVKLIVKGNYCNDTTYRYLKVVPNCYIDVPTAFTPDAVGSPYSTLYPLNAYHADDLEFRVYNRFGQLIFETKDWTKHWDGRVGGADPITGTYVWTLIYTDHDTKERIPLHGTTILIR